MEYVVVAGRKLNSEDTPNDPPELVALLRALDAIAGNRNKVVPEDPALDPLTVVELQLLLEYLSQNQ